MTTFTLQEAKARLEELIEHLPPGEEILITDRGLPERRNVPRGSVRKVVVGNPISGWHRTSTHRWTTSRSVEREPHRAFAIATSTGRPESSFARPKASRPGQENGRSSPAWNPPRRQGCGQTETQVVVPVLRLVPVAVRRAAVPGVVVPATAPDDPVRGLGRPPQAIVKTRLRQRQLAVEPGPRESDQGRGTLLQRRSSSRPAACSRSSQRSFRR